MRARLIKLHSPDANPLEHWVPVGEFGILIQAMVGPEGAEGYESFDFILCTIGWFAKKFETERLVLGRHYIFVKTYSFENLEAFIRNYCANCTGDNWQEVALKVGRIGHWEFEDYRR